MDNLCEKFQEVNEMVGKAKKIFITAHENPDPDAVGSILGINLALKKQNKQTFCYLPSPSYSGLDFLPDFSEIKSQENQKIQRKDLNDFDLFFCLDYGDFYRLQLPQDIEEQKIITLDHHLQGDQRGKIKIIEPELSSTAEIIYLWLKNCPPISHLGKEIATCLLAGIVSDTGGFSHISTSSQTMKIASELILEGAPLGKIVKQVLTFDKTQQTSKVWGKILSRAIKNEKTGLLYSWFSYKDLKKYQAKPTDLSRIANMLSAVSDANTALFLTEYEPGQIVGSLRTEPYKGKNVACLARALGGGGHPNAAGFQQSGTIESVLKKVINLLE